MQQRSTSFAVEALVVVVLAASIWLPEFAHYWISTPSIGAAEFAAARAAPSDTKLAKVAAASVSLPRCANEDPVVAAAAVLRGELPGFPGVHVGIPFRDADLEGLGPAAALAVASLVPVDLLVAGYERSHDARFIDAALAYVSAFDRFERGALAPRGFLWNDHALAARAAALVRLWQRCRNAACADDEVARPVLTQLLRAAEFLASDAHFTVATNHGVMQNLALLQIAAALPKSPRADRYREIAIARLDRQLPFYLSPDGFILEHSPGYQRFGVHLLRRIQQLLELDQGSAPTWRPALLRAEAVLAALSRPDGTLPLIGDTEREPAECARHPTEAGPTPAPRPSGLLLPIAGYSVDWAGSNDSPPAQTVLAWSNYPGHGHKHADDLGITLWRDGRDWLTGVGYWPYDLWGRRYAEGWAASNAPHVADESADIERRNRVRSYAWTADAALIEVSSVRAQGAEFDRQVVRVGSVLWLVVDFAKLGSGPRSVTRTWTAAPGIRIESRADDWVFRDSVHNDAMTLAFAGVPSPEVTRVRGAREPPGGWVVVNQLPLAADALRVTQDGAAAWLATALSFVDSRSPIIVRMTVDDTTRWKAEVQQQARVVAIDREPGSLSIRGPGASTLTLSLERGDDVEASTAAIGRAFDEALSAFPKYRDLHAYRVKISLLVTAAFLVYLLLVYGLRRRLQGNWQLARTLGALCWLGVAAWLHFVYFRV